MIPKVIHYCWFGGKPLPKLAVKCLKSWKKLCPDYRIIRRDETNLGPTFNDHIRDVYSVK